MIPKFSPAVTVYGGMSNLGLTPLVYVIGNISSVKYCDILGEGLLNSIIATNCIPYEFQQDNATPHTSAFTRDSLVPATSRDHPRMGCNNTGSKSY